MVLEYWNGVGAKIRHDTRTLTLLQPLIEAATGTATDSRAQPMPASKWLSRVGLHSHSPDVIPRFLVALADCAHDILQLPNPAFPFHALATSEKPELLLPWCWSSSTISTGHSRIVLVLPRSYDLPLLPMSGAACKEDDQDADGQRHEASEEQPDGGAECGVRAGLIGVDVVLDDTEEGEVDLCEIALVGLP
jgi:hypothetical protein